VPHLFSNAAALWEGVVSHRERLLELPLGASLAQSDWTATKVQRDRNHVLHLVTADGREFFLKLPARLPSDGIISRTALGLAASRAALGAEPLAHLPEFDRVGDDSMELVSRLPGLPLNRYLYGGFLADTPWRFTQTFCALGRALALLHDHQSPSALVVPTDRRTDLRVLAQLEWGGEPALLAEARHVASRWEAAAAPLQFVHGNLAFTNILCHRGRVGFIDFENCGAGFAPDDLSRLLLHFRCLELTGPWVMLTRRATRELMDGYRSLRTLEQGVIGEWLYLHLVDYYQTRFVRHESSRKVAGRRVSRDQVERILTDGPERCTQWVVQRSGR